MWMRSYMSRISSSLGCLRAPGAAPVPPLTLHPTLAPVWPKNTHLSQTEPQTLQGSLALLPGVKLGCSIQAGFLAEGVTWVTTGA